MPRKHETVYYNPGKGPEAVRARVLTVHRIGGEVLRQSL